MNVVKELMGHSDIGTTQTYYTQVDADHENKAAMVIQILLEQSNEDTVSDKTDAQVTPEAEISNLGGN